MEKNYKSCFIIFSLLASLTTSAQSYKEMIREKLLLTDTSKSLKTSDVDDLRLLSATTTKNTDVIHQYYNQVHNNIVILNATVNATFKNNQLLHLGKRIVSNTSQKSNASTPKINPLEAARYAAKGLGLGASNFRLIETVSSKEFILEDGGVSLEPVPVQLVYVSKGNALQLAWDLNVHTRDGKHWWSIQIDALSGEIIDLNDWVVSCSFETHNHNQIKKKQQKAASRNFKLFKNQTSNKAFAGEQYFVYGLPIESPSHGEPSIVIAPQNTTASPFGWHDTDGTEGAEFTTTRGNNVLAWDDIDADNTTPGSLAEGGDEFNFNFEYKFDTDPVNMLDAVTTNLFYWNNIVHDIFHHYGFDEGSGNFQETNYTGDGADGDYVIADAQDGSGLNNANFRTPGDGSNPRMQMFLFSSNKPPRETVTVEDGTLAGSYIGVPAGFGPPLPEDSPITAEVIRALDDNAGASTDELDACDTIINPADLAGKIAIVRRGECEFGTKVLAAENAGAIAVIVVNNTTTTPIGMAPGEVGDQVTIPSLMMGLEDGEAIITALEEGETINVSILFTGPFPIDGDLDNGIIVHEYGHGISNRLTGGRFNSNCMRTCLDFDTETEQCVEGKASEVMSEGWSDYFALMLTMKEGDSGEDKRGIGTYASGQPIDGVGIRPKQYSTDMNINDATYESVKEFENTTAPHPVGYVWATMLWDMTWGLIEQFGYDPDLYNGSGGNNIALQLVVDGLKIQPCNPGFVDGRDAILAAIEENPYLTTIELKRTAGCIIYTAFAKRGLGFSADQGDWREREDGTAAIDFPEGNDNFCNELSVKTFNAAGFSVYPNPSNGILNVRIEKSIGNGTISLFDLNGRLVHSQKDALEGEIRIETSNLSAGIYLLKVQSAVATETMKVIIDK